jgi:putative SOS response-associated peptidase YedK
MCNRYKMDKSAAEVVRLFSAISTEGTNAPAEIYRRYPGLVVAGGKVRSMVWGFPLRLKGIKPDAKPKPINNCRADKLDSFKLQLPGAALSDPGQPVRRGRRREGQQDPHLVRAAR